MRDLTQKEIDQAPGWATNYSFCEDHPRLICYESELFYQFEHQSERRDNVAEMFARSKPIPRPVFDMENYKFTDKDINFIVDDDELKICVDNDRSIFAAISKDDSIAIAKFHKLAPEDLTNSTIK